MTSSNTFLFTYQQDTPRIVTPAIATSLAYDQGLYIATEFTVEKEGDVLYSHPRSILSIVVNDSILYVCDGTLEITRYHLWNARRLKPYLVSHIPCQIKLHQACLYILTQSQLTWIDLRTQIKQTEPLDTSRIYRSVAFYQDRRYFLTVQRDTLEGRVFSTEDLLLGIEDPSDLVLVYPYLFISGKSVKQYDLVQRRIVDLYETTDVYRNINKYGSMAYGGLLIYLFNETRHQVESILAPPIRPNEIKLLSLVPDRGTTGTRVTLTGTNVDLIQTLTLDYEEVELEPISMTSVSFKIPEGKGTPILRVYPEITHTEISHSLTFTYETPRLDLCIPSQCFEGQTLYLYGEYLDKVQYVLINEEKLDPILLKNNALEIRTPPGSGSPTIQLVDRLSNILYSNIMFTYLRLESIICFPAGSLVHADQGIVEIQKLIPGKHTVYGKDIRLITDTYCLDSELVCIEKDAFSDGVPYIRTVISKHHKIFYRKMIEAHEFVGRIPGITLIPYDGKKLYNVLLYVPGRMNVQGMICETLDPSNPIVSQFSQKLMASTS